MDDVEARRRLKAAFWSAFVVHQDADTWADTRAKLMSRVHAEGLADVEGIDEFCEELVEAIRDRTPVGFKVE